MATPERKTMRGYDFHRQKPIDNYIVDFYCNKLKLVIETDGYSHNFEDVYKKDMKKENDLNKSGIKILRLDDKMVLKDINNVLREIEGYIDEFEKPTPLTPLFRGENP